MVIEKRQEIFSIGLSDAQAVSYKTFIFVTVFAAPQRWRLSSFAIRPQSEGSWIYPKQFSMIWDASQNIQSLPQTNPKKVQYNFAFAAFAAPQTPNRASFIHPKQFPMIWDASQNIWSISQTNPKKRCSTILPLLYHNDRDYLRLQLDPNPGQAPLKRNNLAQSGERAHLRSFGIGTTIILQYSKFI